jgi:hypothetical protein
MSRSPQISAHCRRTPNATVEPEAFLLTPDDGIPNRRVLPVLHYPAAIDAAGGDAVDRFETLFSRNGWPPQGGDGIHGFHLNTMPTPMRLRAAPVVPG